jgi:hypothetical protein
MCEPGLAKWTKLRFSLTVQAKHVQGEGSNVWDYGPNEG